MKTAYNTLWCRLTCAAVWALLVLVNNSPAAEDDAFDAPAAKGAAKGPAVDEKGRRKEKGPAEVEITRQEPIVILQLRERNPSTPHALVEAAKITLDYGRPDEAKKYLAKLLAAKAEASVLAELAKTFGADLFLRFSNTQALRPEGDKVASVVLKAYDESVHSPARLEEFVSKLSSENASQRKAARTDLVAAGTYAFPALFKVLADEGQGAIHVEVQRTLIEMGPLAEAPLLAALDSPSALVQTKVTEVLSAGSGKSYATRLLRPALDSKSDPQLKAAAQHA